MRRERPTPADRTDANPFSGRDSPTFAIGQTRTIDTDANQGRNIRIRLRVPAGMVAGLAEVQITGALKGGLMSPDRSCPDQLHTPRF